VQTWFSVSLIDLEMSYSVALAGTRPAIVVPRPGLL
jgi:hypothetical protein